MIQTTYRSPSVRNWNASFNSVQVLSSSLYRNICLMRSKHSLVYYQNRSVIIVNLCLTFLSFPNWRGKCVIDHVDVSINVKDVLLITGKFNMTYVKIFWWTNIVYYKIVVCITRKWNKFISIVWTYVLTKDWQNHFLAFIMLQVFYAYIC